MKKLYLTVVIPCFNEKNTILEIIKEIKKLKNLKIQIILVDDGSTDGTREIIKKNLKNKIDKIIFHKINQGKGAAIISSIKYIKGEYVIIQDADLEYDPRDYYNLLRPFKNKDIDLVYGSRVLGRLGNINNKKNYANFKSKFRIFGNYVLTKLSNLINNQNLTDVHTCYKVVRKEVFLSLKLKEKSFAFCPEVTTKASNLSYVIKEVPIKYKGREVNEGKKIRFKDAIIALITIIKYKIFKKI
jgi:dolichol-phosphate mannosyltransferase